MTPEEALKTLMDGNERYVNDKLLHPNRSQETREALKYQQNPFAIILGCSDSRVSPEIVFDQGIGDLFVVRVAGNVAGPIELDSIDFSAVILGSAIIMVLGHENCGAVTAVLQHNTKDIEAVAAKIEPAISHIKDDNLEAAVKANVRSIVQQLKNSPVLSKLIQQKRIDVVGGYYRLASGKIELLK